MQEPHGGGGFSKCSFPSPASEILTEAQMGPGMHLLDQVPQVLLIQGISTAWNITDIHLLQLRQYGSLERLSYMIKSNTTNCLKEKVTECSWLALQN